MSVTRDEVLAALGAVAHPRSGVALPEADVIRALEIEDGAVRLILDVPAADAAAMQAARAEAEARIAALDGVASASVLLTAPRAAPEDDADDAPRSLPGVARVIAVGSGKGGVGKSTVSANLALALADLGLRVGLLDADLCGPSQPRMMGAPGRPIGRENTLVPLAAHGIKMMSVGSLMEEGRALVWRGPILANAIAQLLRDVAWAPLDVLVADLPPGTGDVQIALSQTIPLDGAVIVTTPQDIALLDARRAIDMFRQTGTPVLGLIENMSTHVCSNCGQEDAVFGHGGGEAEAAAQGIRFLGALPLTRALRETSDTGTPMVRAAPDSAEAARFREIAAALAETLPDAPDAPDARGNARADARADMGADMGADLGADLGAESAA